MIKEQKTQRQIFVDADDTFGQHEFSTTAGYSHYAPQNEIDRINREESIDDFLAADTAEEPVVAPNRYSNVDIEETASTYENLVDQLIRQKDRSPEEEALIDTIINKTGELFRYEELSLAAGAIAIGERDAHRQLAADIALETIGGIDTATWSSLLNKTIDLAELSDSTYAKQLLGLVERQPVAGFEEDSFELEAQTREIIFGDLVTLFPVLKDLLSDNQQGAVSPEAAVELWKQLQKKAGMEGWTTELDDGKSARTSGKNKTVYVGRNRSPFASVVDCVATGFHEAIVHGKRSEGVKLPGSLDFEEGVAVRLQQIISGEERTPGTQYYLSVGLQAGVDQAYKPRTYRETFEILRLREILLAEQKGKPLDLQLLASNAQRQVHRTRRGGAIDTRDTSYFVGAQKASVWLNEIAKLPEEQRLAKLNWVLSAAFDPTLPEHIAIMERVS